MSVNRYRMSGQGDAQQTSYCAAVSYAVLHATIDVCICIDLSFVARMPYCGDGDSGMHGRAVRGVVGGGLCRAGVGWAGLVPGVGVRRQGG
ncbi:hypothetical protein V495_05730 [Pseudogymnoascus sp. VKM F-4514 (FW-929)]|nr:hypothetical protein V495_05730 [Pseudogymnoascus sp. VKM F-4514 (FW-929)]